MKKKPIIADFAHCRGHQLFMPFSVPSRNFAPPSVWAPESRKRQPSRWKDAKEKINPCIRLLSFQDFYTLKVKYTLNFPFIYFFALQARAEKKKKKSLKARRRSSAKNEQFSVCGPRMISLNCLYGPQSGRGKAQVCC